MNRFNKIFYTKKKVYEPQGKSEKKKKLPRTQQKEIKGRAYMNQDMWQRRENKFHGRIQSQFQKQKTKNGGKGSNQEELLRIFQK